MLNKNIPTNDLKRIKLVVFDSDGVSIPRGTAISERVTPESIEMNIKTHMITLELTSLLKRLRERFIVCVSSGRSLLYLQTMYGPIIGKNTILQAENGNVSLIDGMIVQHEKYDEQYFETLSHIRSDVRKLDIKGVEPKQFILSVHADKEIKKVYEIVERHDEREELRVMWNGEAFDIQRKNVSKATGLVAIRKHLGLEKEEVMAMGDRVNDIEMLNEAGIGVSADKNGAPAEYWTEGEGMPGQILAEYLVQQFNL